MSTAKQQVAHAKTKIKLHKILIFISILLFDRLQ